MPTTSPGTAAGSEAARWAMRASAGGRRRAPNASRNSSAVPSAAAARETFSEVTMGV